MSCDLDVFALKDAFWKLTARVAIVENFIAEKFGKHILSDVRIKQSTSRSGNSTIVNKLKTTHTKPPHPKQHSVSGKRKCSRISTKLTKKAKLFKRVYCNDDASDSDLIAEDSCSEDQSVEDESNSALIPKVEDSDIFYEAKEGDDENAEMNYVNSDDEEEEQEEDSSSQEKLIQPKKDIEVLKELPPKLKHADPGIKSREISNDFVSFYESFITSRRRKKFHLPTRSEYKVFLKVLHSTKGESINNIKPWEKKTIVDAFGIMIRGEEEVIVGKLCRRPVATVEEVEDILVASHNERAHAGRDGTMKFIQKTWYYMPYEIVRAYVATCKICLGRKASCAKVFKPSTHKFNHKTFHVGDTVCLRIPTVYTTHSSVPLLLVAKVLDQSQDGELTLQTAFGQIDTGISPEQVEKHSESMNFYGAPSDLISLLHAYNLAMGNVNLNQIAGSSSDDS